MRPSDILAVVFAIACIAPLPLSAQSNPPSGCYGGAAYQSCQTPQGSCSTQIYTAPPTTSGWSYVWVPVTCCDYNTWKIETYEDFCLSAELREPETLKRLAALSKESDLLVASCDGYLRHVRPFVVSDKKPEQSVSMPPDRRSLLPDDRLTH